MAPVVLWGVQTVLPDAACPGLPRKPLDAAIRHYLLRIAPVATRAIANKTTMETYIYFAGRFDGNGDAPVCYCAGNGRGPGLYQKPLDPTIGQVLCPIT
jgi:hypothetical protein